MEYLTSILLVCALLSLAEALYSLKGGLEFARLLRKFHKKVRQASPPGVSLIIPCKDVDSGLEQNLTAYFGVNYPDFQILLVTGSEDDLCLPVLRWVRDRNPQVVCRILFAGPADGRGQKVHNLLYALEHLRAHDRVIAFGDSDIRPGKDWLQDLVEPLADPEVGLSTGFRWYLPQKGNLASVLRSVWNAGAVSLMQKGDCLFAWGGAMAIRREVFVECRVPDYWRGALSDDFAISRAVHEHSRSIRFQPRCLSFSHEDCGLGELLEWTARQLSITRVYHPVLWKKAFLAHGVNSVTLWGGGLFLACRLWLPGISWEWSDSLLLALMGCVYLLGGLKGYLRLGSVSRLFQDRAEALRRHWPALVFAGPLVSLISLRGFVHSLFSRRIRWRGIGYLMISPNQTRVLERTDD